MLKILLIIMTIPFSFIKLMAMEDEYAYFCASSKDRTTYTFSQKVETMKEEEESPLSDKDFLEVVILLKKGSQIRNELSALKSQRREIEQNGSYIDICYDCYDPISTFFLINLVREEDEIESELNELDQLTQDLMRDIYLRTGRQHPKMRFPTEEIEEDGKPMPTSQPFVRKTMIYTFNEEGKMIGREKEDEPPQSEEIFLESESLLKEESQTQSKIDHFGNMLVASLWCPCLMPCVIIYGCMIFYRQREMLKYM